MEILDQNTKMQNVIYKKYFKDPLILYKLKPWSNIFPFIKELVLKDLTFKDLVFRTTSLPLSAVTGEDAVGFVFTVLLWCFTTVCSKHDYFLYLRSPVSTVAGDIISCHLIQGLLNARLSFGGSHRQHRGCIKDENILCQHWGCLIQTLLSNMSYICVWSWGDNHKISDLVINC